MSTISAIQEISYSVRLSPTEVQTLFGMLSKLEDSSIQLTTKQNVLLHTLTGIIQAQVQVTEGITL